MALFSETLYPHIIIDIWLAAFSAQVDSLLLDQPDWQLLEVLTDSSGLHFPLQLLSLALVQDLNSFRKFLKFWYLEPSGPSSSSLPKTSLLFPDLVPPCRIQLPSTCSYQGISICQLVMWHICFELFLRLRTLTNVSPDVLRYCPPPTPPSPGLCLATQPGLR